MPDAPRPTVVVIGAGMSGLLAAAALAGHADVILVERDTLPAGPEPRRGVPQARHAHMVWTGGVTALDTLLPGLTEELVARGARLAHIMGDMVSRAPNEIWFRRFTSTPHRNLVCSRDLLDAVTRERVLADPRITLRQNTTAAGIDGDAARVTGLHVRAPDAEEEHLAADFVIDATGRGSRAPTWLQGLGLPAVPEHVVDSGVAYATRVYRAPAEDFPLVNVQANPAVPPGQGGIILPVEDGRWIVTLSGTRGGEPTDDTDAFTDFALGLGDPVIGELIRDATPLTEVVTTRSTANRRRYFEKLRHWPDGFIVIGDAIAGYNPVYGHGITVAAQSAVALREYAATTGLTRPGGTRRLQKSMTRPVAAAWDLAIGQDIFYPGASDQPPTRVERALAAFVDRAVATGARNPRALAALLDVMSLSRPATRLFSSDMLLPMLFGPKRAFLEKAPLSDEERKSAV
ncbi:NAD(P)/FAD-dependent oxidoreductase [Streptomyces sp. NRRL F-2799]|uniref:NAD(P)/FAD-dependent oxidoreductase n=1 Tax=Streptomyces sp. NRRL F-2799 TaxID=1463844 RepID=UPI0004C7EA00|nr:FAD-dependent monooxygenase [Streptomyces sp. NRRL F-2799]